jgi:hypothetical protein
MGLDDPAHWKWEKDRRYVGGGKWRCVTKKRLDNAAYARRLRADPVRGPRARERGAEYRKRNAHWARLKSYRAIDKKLGRESITWTEAKPLMDEPCHYCAISPGGGLDRIDNSLGHAVTNVRPCCAKCNTILGDLPVEAKDLLADGLRASREGGWLETWVIPQMRHLL